MRDNPLKLQAPYRRLRKGKGASYGKSATCSCSFQCCVNTRLSNPPSSTIYDQSARPYTGRFLIANRRPVYRRRCYCLLLQTWYPMDQIEKNNHRPSVTPFAGRAVALLDARYLRWMARLDEPDAQSSGPVSRERLNEIVQHALGRAVGRVSLLRLYWYAEVDDRLVCNDQTLRLLPSADVDGSALVRQLAVDVQALVASGRIDVILLGSDDDRLLPVIEAAKLAGVTVGVLADERALAMPRLMQQDPNWARLLREADRRVVVRSAELAQALRSGSMQGQMHDDGGGVSEGFEEALKAVVQSWWADQTDDDRDGLREELPAQRGLPSEVDRDLLLRGKNAMGRALSFHEKRVLRSQARDMALGPQSAPPQD